MFVNAQWLLLAYEMQRLWEDIDNQFKQLRIQWVLYKSNDGYEAWKKWQDRWFWKYNEAIFLLLLNKRESIFKKLDLISGISGKVVENTLKDFTNKTGLWVDTTKSLKEFLVNHINETADNMRKNEIKTYEDLMKDIETKHEKSRDEWLNLPKEEQVKKSKEQLKEDIIDIYNNTPDKQAIRERQRIEIERDLRTSLQREATAITIDTSKQNGYVFFLCNELRDSASDHANFQAKVYYTKDYKEVLKDKKLIEDAETLIKQQNMLCLEDIIDGTIKYTFFTKKGLKRERGVFLTTRWNCRHYFRPITLDEAKKPDEAIKKYDMSTGNYKPENYDALQLQRRLEREIRDKKSQRLIVKEQLKYSTNNKVLKDDLKRLNKDIKELTEQLEKLCEQYNLPRAYNREQVESLTYDLGIKKEE